jgi:hypothetical protein
VAALAGIIEFVAGQVAGGCSHAARHPWMLLAPAAIAAENAPEAATRMTASRIVALVNMMISSCLDCLLTFVVGVCTMLTRGDLVNQPDVLPTRRQKSRGAGAQVPVCQGFRSLGAN